MSSPEDRIDQALNNHARYRELPPATINPRRATISYRDRFGHRSTERFPVGTSPDELLARVSVRYHNLLSSEQPYPIFNSKAILLTPRQQEVFQLITRGMSNPEIAEELGIAFNTVKQHVSAILDRLGLSNRQAVIFYAHALRDRAEITDREL